MEFLDKLQAKRRQIKQASMMANAQNISNTPSQVSNTGDSDDMCGAAEQPAPPVPTKRTTEPAFVANLRRIKENAPAKVGESLEPLPPRGRGMIHAGSSIRPPSTLGRGRRHMESIDATTVRTASSVKSVGLGRGRGRAVGLGRGMATLVPAPSIAESKAEESLYSKFSFEQHPVDVSNLPIMAHRESIISTVNSNPVTIIHGSTGCGKSTQVPQIILDDAVKRNVPCNIVITQPRRIAAQSLAERVSRERDWEVGEPVGYQIGLRRKLSEDTKILYVTVGVLIEKLIHVGDLGQWTHIILDEVHERSQDMDLTLLIVKQLFLEKRTSTKIILMSASAQTERLSEYFSTYEPMYDNPDDIWSDMNAVDEYAPHKSCVPPILYIDGRQYPVDVFYLDDIERILKEEKFDVKIETNIEMEESVWFEDRRRILKNLILYFDVIDKRAAEESGLPTNEGRGTVLVFLPGISQIIDVKDFLQGYKADTSIGEGTEDTTNRWDVVPLHSSISQVDQYRVFKNPGNGYRRVILSTNIAESSITVPDIRYVVDFCTTKRLRRNASSEQFSTLKLEYTSKSSCEQRKGRAGRLASGRCYRLVTKETYDCLGDFCPAEMQIAPLEHVILRIKLFKRDPVFLLNTAMDKPDTQDIGHAILTLKEVGALTVMRKRAEAVTNQEEMEDFQYRQETHGGCMVKNCDHMDGDLTFVGRIISRLPVDVHIGKLIALGYVFGVLKEAIIVGSGICGSRSVFYQPFQGDKAEHVLDAYEKRLRFASATHSDCFAVLNAYNRYEKFMNSEYRGRRKDLDNFCNPRFLDARALNEMKEMVMEITSRLSDMGIEVPPQRLPNIEAKEDESVMKSFMLQLAIAGAFYPNYFLRKHNYALESIAQRMFGDKDPMYCVELGQFPMNKGLLYKKQLEDYYKRICLKNYKGTNCSVRIHTHDSKAVVDFSDIERYDPKVFDAEQNRVTRSAALPVYLALKAKQIPRLRPYVFKVNETDAIQKAMADIQRQSLLKYQSGTTTHDNSRLLYENHIGFPGLKTKHIEVKVTYVKHCCYFYGIYRENEKDLKTIESIINRNTNNNLSNLKLYEVVPNVVCLAMRTVPKAFRGELGDRMYARAIIENCTERDVGKKWRVKFLDYGGYESVSESLLLKLPEELYQYRYLALECQIAEVQPHSVFRPYGEYSRDDKVTFERKLYRMKYVNLNIYSLVGSCLRVRLDISLDFLGSNAIEHKEEDLPSQSDHLERLKERRLTGPRPSDSYATNSLADSESGWKNSHEKFLAEEERLVKKLTACIIKSGAVERQRMNVTGPDHPYEVRFSGMTSFSNGKKISVAADSVNSIFIDDQPQSHLDRLMVAGLVQSGPSESGNLVLRHTTVMPNLPGLPALLAMIFAPVAELRVNKNTTRYSGAVCGLGFDESGHPIHPNNDIEVIFDTYFDSHTLRSVNEIRLGLNLILTETEWRDDSIGSHPKVVMNLQDKIENAVKNLFLSAKPVHLVNRVRNAHPFCWRLLPPTRFADNSKQIAQFVGSNDIFQCHYSINGVDDSGVTDYLRALSSGVPFSEEIVPSTRQILDFQPRWKEDMKAMLKKIYEELARVVDMSTRTVTGELESTFICELCPSRPESHCYGYICPTVNAVREHLSSESHRRAEAAINFKKSTFLNYLDVL